MTKACMGWVAALAVTLSVAVVAGEGKTFGEGVPMSEATPIATVVAHGADYVGKVVRVDGIVTAVCENMGCWMVLKDEKSDATLRLKVDDGVMVFPVSAKGKKASAQGTIEKIDAAAEAAHHAASAAAEHKEEPTPAGAYQLRPTGVVIHD
ncbi:MAG: DUF4920 domain-containing protein [Vicinamibacteraceae bacterium]|nr:DUF4920 domain-containing protein [Vicinamibacteraceae bacterium]